MRSRFREEGEKEFEIYLKYGAQKVYDEINFGKEFILDKREIIKIQVHPPFQIEYNWIIQDPYYKALNQKANSIPEETPLEKQPKESPTKSKDKKKQKEKEKSPSKKPQKPEEKEKPSPNLEEIKKNTIQTFILPNKKKSILLAKITPHTSTPQIH